MAHLNDDQKRQIRTYLRERGITYRELEDELFDHITSAVEAEMAKGNSFYEASKKVFLGFGKFGFRKIQAAYEDSLDQSGLQMLWQQFKTYLTYPKVFLTVLLLAGLWNVSGWEYALNAHLYPLGMGLILVIGGIFKGLAMKKQMLRSWKNLGFYLFHNVLMINLFIYFLLIIFGGFNSPISWQLSPAIFWQKVIFTGFGFVLTMSLVIYLESIWQVGKKSFMEVYN